MATDTVITKRSMLEAFRQRSNPTLFLSSWFKTKPEYIFLARKCAIDTKRNGRAMAVDVIPGTGGRLINNKRYTTKEYIPPAYNLYNSYSPDELNDRMPGSTEYDNPEYALQLMQVLTADQIVTNDMILRAKEWQAANAFVTGTVPLINNDIVDFKQKATHNFAPSVVWSNSSGVPNTDLYTACELNNTDGQVAAAEQIAIFGATAWTNYLSRTTGSGSAFDMQNAKLGDINLPVTNTEGAAYHGMAAAGPYKVQLWSYPQNYEVPIGFGLANEGTEVPYIPADKVVVVPPSNLIDLRTVFAGIPDLVKQTDPQLIAMLGGDRMPANRRVESIPYAYVDAKKYTFEVGVKSAPLVVPTQIDGYSVIKTEG